MTAEWVCCGVLNVPTGKLATQAVVNNSVAPCRVAIEIAPLCKIFAPTYKHRDNDFTERCDFDSDSPARSHRIVLNRDLQQVWAISGIFGYTREIKLIGMIVTHFFGLLRCFEITFRGS